MCHIKEYFKNSIKIENIENIENIRYFRTKISDLHQANPDKNSVGC